MYVWKSLRGFFKMKDEYDFSQSVSNPYISTLKTQITLTLEEDVINYFDHLSQETGIPYSSLINLYLRDCVQSQRKLSLDWT